MKISRNHPSRTRPFWTLFIMTVLAAVISLPTSALAGTRLVIDYDQLHVRGRNMVLPLRRHIRERFPDIDLGDYDLARVKLVAKSRKGRGRGRLLVGSWDSHGQRIGGQPRDFHKKGRSTYDKMVFHNEADSSRGRWQLRLDGNIKIKRVVVKLRKKPRHVRRHGRHQSWTRTRIIEPHEQRTVVVQRRQHHRHDRNDANLAVPLLALNLFQLLAQK